MKIHDNYGLEAKYFNLDLDEVVLYTAPQTVVNNPTTDATLQEAPAVLPVEQLRCTSDGVAEISVLTATNEQKDSLQSIYGGGKVRGKMEFKAKDGTLVFSPTKKGSGSGNAQLVLPKMEVAQWKISKTSQGTKFSISFPNDISLSDLTSAFNSNVKELKQWLALINEAYMHPKTKHDAIRCLDRLQKERKSELQGFMNLNEYYA